MEQNKIHKLIALQIQMFTALLRNHIYLKEIDVFCLALNCLKSITS